jgi:hypothetical protein
MAQLRVTDAVPKLRGLLIASHRSAVRTVVAAAIFELTGDASMEGVVADVATNQENFWGSRIDAIYLLARFKSRSAFDALSGLTHDPNDLVRYNAKRAGGRTG